MPKNKFDWESIFKKYSDLHAREIARRVGSSANVVIEAANRLGFTLVEGKAGTEESYDWPEIFRVGENQTIQEIAYTHKISVDTVRRAFTRYCKEQPDAPKFRETSTRYDWDDIFRTNKGRNGNQIAIETGANPTTVRSAARRLGVRLPFGKKL